MHVFLFSLPALPHPPVNMAHNLAEKFVKKTDPVLRICFVCFFKKTNSNVLFLLEARRVLSCI